MADVSDGRVKNIGFVRVGAGLCLFCSDFVHLGGSGQTFNIWNSDSGRDRIVSLFCGFERGSSGQTFCIYMKSLFCMVTNSVYFDWSLGVQVCVRC